MLATARQRKRHGNAIAVHRTDLRNSTNACRGNSCEREEKWGQHNYFAEPNWHASLESVIAPAASRQLATGYGKYAYFKFFTQHFGHSRTHSRRIKGNISGKIYQDYLQTESHVILSIRNVRLMIVADCRISRDVKYSNGSGSRVLNYLNVHENIKKKLFGRTRFSGE